MEIRIVPQVENWLAGIRDHDPAVADGIDEAVAALRAEGTSVGPPLVVPVERPSRRDAVTSIPGGRSVSASATSARGCAEQAG